MSGMSIVDTPVVFKCGSKMADPDAAISPSAGELVRQAAASNDEQNAPATTTRT